MPVLQFKGKTAVEQHHRLVPHHVLELDGRLSLAKDPSLDGNLIIEGDNLLALKALMPTHAGKVNCIYIDPPYNTGNEGWIYNDKLQQPQFKEWIGREVGKEGEDACRHDKWCCMMYPRLSLLRELLSDGGHILVSIDDNEMYALRAMMDEIFGEHNFVGCISWKTRNTDNRVKTMLSVDHEYVLVYARGGAPLRGRVIDRSNFQNPDGDPRGPYVTDPLTGKATSIERPNLHYVIVNPSTGEKYEPDPARGWITDVQGMKVLLDEGRVWWPPDPAKGKPRKKRYLSETKERMPASTYWAHLKGQSGADEVDNILGKRLFAFPKSVEFMTAVLDLALPEDGLVLDATAGSGTTAHAVLALNAEDGGARRFVLAQLPHDSKSDADAGLNICRSITRERVTRVSKGYKSLSGERVAGLGGDFTYVRLGAPLFDESKSFGGAPPSFEDLAKYIWFTDTSQPFSPKQVKKKTGHIGTWRGTSYYLLYSPDGKGRTALDREFLKGLEDDAAKKVIYCEKVWIHRDELREFGQIVPMVLPFHLK